MTTAIIGVGGGVFLISLMPVFVPTAAIIPIHGVVQLASNFSRALFGITQVDWKVFLPFAGGACLGVAAGSRFVLMVPLDFLPLVLGTFILIMVWMPGIRDRVRLPGKFITLGAAQGVLTLFLGATGPLNPPFLLREGLGKDRLVVTQAAMMTALHFLKVLAFGLLGFLFRPYLYLVAGMILSVTLGSYTGTAIRSRVSEKVFLQIFKGVVTLLALRMMVKALLP